MFWVIASQTANLVYIRFNFFYFSYKQENVKEKWASHLLNQWAQIAILYLKAFTLSARGPSLFVRNCSL